MALGAEPSLERLLGREHFSLQLSFTYIPALVVVSLHVRLKSVVFRHFPLEFSVCQHSLNFG